ncbi:MAG: SCO family protein, partial [Myxococcota bacterium]|nr:SCO family protein [Myxococcota bacterium]
QVQQLLGDRADQDVFMYSITIDPETDSPEVLAAYREQFKIGPGWTFLTGSEEDIELLQRKLGLLIEDLEDPNDHNVSLIVGNEATGRWMKRSPYDNPHILAGLLMDSLHNWKVPRPAGRSYATAEKLPAFTRGEYLFRTRCNACHTIGQGDGVGPDLIGIVEKRDPDWLARWLMEPDAMIAEEDPIALQILAEYGDVRMPNLRLTDIETTSLIEHLRDESMRVSQARTAEPEPHAHHVAQPGDVGQGGGHGEHAHH